MQNGSFYFFTLLIILAFSSLRSNAQNRSGLAFGKYNGLTASHLNPSYLLKSQNPWEVQIAGAHMFFETNYGHIKNTSLFNLISNSDLVNIPDIAYDDVTEANQYDVLFNTEYKKTYFDGKSDVFGPGGFFKINKNIAIGVSSKFRGALTSFDIPSSLNYYNVSQLPGNQLFVGNTFQINALAWSEYSFHYAQSFSKLSVGANLKYLNGYTSFSFDNNFDINYIEKSDTLTSIDPGQFTLAHPIHEGEQPSVIGNGWAIDLGINYQNEDGSFIGISIIDLGYVNLNGKNYIINFDANQSIIYEDYKAVKTIDQQITQMKKDGFAIDSTSGHKIILPTAISLQYQKSFSEKLSIEAQLTQSVTLSDYQVRQPNSLTVSAIYDQKHFSAFFPITMYNYNHIRVGAALRFAFLTIGSDRLFSIFTNQDNFNGSDFYINLKYYPFPLKKSNSSKVNCFSF